jgi:hypothetical protein
MMWLILDSGIYDPAGKAISAALSANHDSKSVYVFYIFKVCPPAYKVFFCNASRT